MAVSASQHILELSRELLDDIELTRLETSQILLKAARLVRLAGSDEASSFVNYELYGYSSTEPLSREFMTKTGRWINLEKTEGYFGPLAVQEGSFFAAKSKLAALSLPSVGGDYANLAIQSILTQINSATGEVKIFGFIRARALAELHKFVSQIYYEREFANVAETMFEKYKAEVDIKIASKAGDVLSKIPSITSRLSDGDVESVSQALVTMRRIIDAFADHIFPPREGTFSVDGNELAVDASKHKNRINAYVAQRCTSQSRRTKIRQNLSNLYDRVSTGVHKEVSIEEAFSLFLNTYLLLGEIIHIAEDKT